MRYYDLQITPQGATTPFRQWTSHPNGIFNPQAQNIEFDIPITTYDAPVGEGTITIHGVSLQDLQQANSWGLHPTGSTWQAGMNVTLRAGMQKGLPLANPKQAGLILSGQVVQAFGNWEGTDMTLDLVVQAAAYSIEKPGNIVLTWRAGTELSTALKNCLSVAFPDLPSQINISSGLVLPYDVVHMAATLTDLATWLLQFTDHRLLDPVLIAFNAGTITVIDAQYVAPTRQIVFTDLIGQPVWIEPGVMQSKFVRRADLQVGGTIQMPQGLQDLPGIVLTQAASQPSQLRTHTTFPSQFYVRELRHIGNFRSPDGSQWATVANCIIPPGAA